jgi:hypothetical protein
MFRKSGCEPRASVAAVRRLITLITVLAAALLGSAAAAVPAQAKVPDPNGQIVFGRFNTGLGDFQIFTANPDGTSQAQLQELGAASANDAPPAPHQTSRPGTEKETRWPPGRCL